MWNWIMHLELSWSCVQMECPVRTVRYLPQGELSWEKGSLYGDQRSCKTSYRQWGPILDMSLSWDMQNKENHVLVQGLHLLASRQTAMMNSMYRASQFLPGSSSIWNDHSMHVLFSLSYPKYRFVFRLAGHGGNCTKINTPLVQWNWSITTASNTLWILKPVPKHSEEPSYISGWHLLGLLVLLLFHANIPVPGTGSTRWVGWYPGFNHTPVSPGLPPRHNVSRYPANKEGNTSFNNW